MSTIPSSSRSSSPDTPESDGVEPSLMNGDVDLSSWYHTLDTDTKMQPSWLPDSAMLVHNKSEDAAMLRLDDLIEQNAYEDSVFAIDTAYTYSGQPGGMQGITPHVHTASQQFFGAVPPAKAVPPPAPTPRRQESSSQVVRPPKETCYNLPIVFPSIPEHGAKSRVETQIRVTVELADSIAAEPHKYHRVGSWQWLKLPSGTATKRRTRKQGKIDAEPDETLELSVSVSCSSPPHNRVLSCSSCQAREAKRVAKKIAARVRPARSDSESDTGNPHPKMGKHRHEDTTSIIQFNCPEVVDFSSGSVVLPLRITCYCRHHREKAGFNVHFTMMDHLGRIVGAGSTRPIMITDDHKAASAQQNTKAVSSAPPSLSNIEIDWTRAETEAQNVEQHAPSKRKQEIGPSTKKRTKPYDSSAKPSKQTSREASVSSAPSPASTTSTLPPMTRSPTPPNAPMFGDVDLQTLPPRGSISTESESSPLMTPVDSSTFDLSMFNTGNHSQLAGSAVQDMVNSIVMPTHPHPMPPLFFESTQGPLMPVIHRLIPSSGPTHGGIEVTILGANFFPSMQLTCVFGDSEASSTQRWSDNALVCVLPPRATPGVVAVWFKGFEQSKTDASSSSPPSLFTYSDESDRALMELALQVVGLKMTGKIEDAKNVAMRIVGGNDASDSSGSGLGAGQPMTHNVARDLRPALLRRAGEIEDLESLIVDFMSVIDAGHNGASGSRISIGRAMSYQTSNGHTMLHLAAFLSLSKLVGFLLEHRIDIDVRDRNGYTALHFAVFARSRECLELLLAGGADVEIVDNLGHTPEELCSDESLRRAFDRDSVTVVDEEEEEAQFGDEEDEAETDLIPRRIRSKTKRLGSKTPSRISSTPHTPRPIRRDDKPSSKQKPHPEFNIDEKHVASFVETIQRTLAQLPGSPQLPLQYLPNLPHIPGMPGNPFNALPQMPIAFPVYIAMPRLPAFLGKAETEGTVPESVDDANNKVAIEWRRILTLGALGPSGSPHVYPPTPTETAPPTKETSVRAEASTSSDSRRSSRRASYVPPSLTEQEVDAYAYQPRVHQKKHDRMLVLFWIPILFLSLIWALHHGVVFAVRTAKTALSLKVAARN